MGQSSSSIHLHTTKCKRFNSNASRSRTSLSGLIGSISDKHCYIACGCRVANVTTPTLIMCGEKDWNVPVQNSDQLYQALVSTQSKHNRTSSAIDGHRWESTMRCRGSLDLQKQSAVTCAVWTFSKSVCDNRSGLGCRRRWWCTRTSVRTPAMRIRIHCVRLQIVRIPES